jgi:hypothetical protein
MEHKLSYFHVPIINNYKRPRLRWEDYIKMDLREIGFGDVDWIH